MRISYWSSDLCSSDLDLVQHAVHAHAHEALRAQLVEHLRMLALALADHRRQQHPALVGGFRVVAQCKDLVDHLADDLRSEEHTSELQSLLRISYAVFCLKKQNKISTDRPPNS